MYLYVTAENVMYFVLWQSHHKLKAKQEKYRQQFQKD